ncbi:MAG TPA: hypothetical protein VHV31_08820 [Nitrolancea sp.]|jgi:hypothetical protein|nr:hypothetical protein [Nitrolancea sp.]
MLAWIIVVVVLGLVFAVGIERLLSRLGIQRQQPDEPATTMHDLRSRVEAWQRKQASKPKRERPQR